MPASLFRLLSEDYSSKVTCHLILAGLGNSACLTGPPQLGSTWGTCNEWPSNWDLHLQLPNHLWLPDHLHPWLSEQLNLSIFSSSKAATANTQQWASHAMVRTSLHDPSVKSLVVTHGMHLVLKFNLQIWPRSASRTPSQSFLWLCAIPPVPEAFLNRVQNILAGPLLCLHITGAFAGWPPWHWSRKRSALSCLSASHTEISSSFASFVAVAVFAVWLSHFRLDSVW